MKAGNDVLFSFEMTDMLLAIVWQTGVLCWLCGLPEGGLNGIGVWVKCACGGVAGFSWLVFQAA